MSYKQFYYLYQFFKDKTWFNYHSDFLKDCVESVHCLLWNPNGIGWKAQNIMFSLYVCISFLGISFLSNTWKLMQKVIKRTGWTALNAPCFYVLPTKFEQDTFHSWYWDEMGRKTRQTKWPQKLFQLLP